MKEKKELTQSLFAIPMMIAVVYIIYKFFTLFAWWIYIFFALVIFLIFKYEK